MKTYKIELSSEPLKKGRLTSRGIIKELVELRFGERYLLHTGTQEGGIYLKHLKCIEVEYFYPDITQSKEITDPVELQQIWEAIRGEEPKKEWRLAHLDWQNFTLKEGTYQVDIELMHGEILPDNNFEELLQKELNKLPYEKHVDDGCYNDGQIDGFEIGARWANSLHNNNGWISVEDSLPDESGRYWGYVEIQTDLGLSKYQDNVSFNKEEKRWSSDIIKKEGGIVTHYTNLLPPPRH